MISFRPFWDTLEKSNETWYTLIKDYHFSSSTLSRLKNNKPVSSATLNDLCRILNCNIDQIAEYIPSDEDQPL